MSEWYILNPDHTVTKTEDMVEASKALADRDKKIVAQTVGAGERFVSTVFLGLDHSWMGGPPLIFETMIFEKGWLTKERPKIDWDRIKRGKKVNFSKRRPNERTDIHDWQDRYSTWDEAVAGHVRALALLQREFPGNLYANKRRRLALHTAYRKRRAAVETLVPPAVIVHEVGAFS